VRRLPLAKRRVLLGAAFVMILAAAAAFVLLGRQGQDGSLERVQQSGRLVIALEASYPPFETTDGQGNYGGFDVELGREIARRLGVEPQFANIAFDSLYDALYSRKADVIISGLRYEAERTRDVLYSPPYLDAGQVVLVRSGDPITRAQGLAGRTVGVESASEGEVEASKLQRKTPGMRLRPFETPQLAAAALAAGDVDGVVTDYVTAAGIVKSAPGLHLLLPPFAADPLVIAGNIQDRRLMSEISRILSNLRAEGWLDQLAKSSF
jgi:polar amino acid transport system substrate-binding protein